MIDLDGIKARARELQQQWGKAAGSAWGMTSDCMALVAEVERLQQKPE